MRVEWVSYKDVVICMVTRETFKISLYVMCDFFLFFSIRFQRRGVVGVTEIPGYRIVHSTVKISIFSPATSDRLNPDIRFPE